MAKVQLRQVTKRYGDVEAVRRVLAASGQRREVPPACQAL